MDKNQAEIVEALRKVGCRVAPTFSIGDGFPDLVCGTPSGKDWFKPKRIVLLEIKDSSQPPSRRRLTPEQEAWHALWEGYPVYVVETVEQALEAVK